MAFYFNPSKQHPLVPSDTGPLLDTNQVFRGDAIAGATSRGESLSSVLSARSESPSVDAEWVVFSPHLSVTDPSAVVERGSDISEIGE
jgi:hypothetical protein